MKDGIFFNQSMYIKEMLKKFGQEYSKPMKTPMCSDTKLTKDEECESVDSTKYRGMIGLWYPTGTGIETVVYADSDHAGHYVDRKSTSDFAQILRIPCEGACVISDRWSLDELVYGAPLEGPYQTNLPSPDNIISYIREDREEQKPRRDRGTTRGRHSTSSSTFNQPSLSHLNDDDDDDDDDDGNNKETSRASTPPIRQLFVNISIDEDFTTTPSPITTSSSLTPPNAPLKTTSTNQTSSSHKNTSTSFQSKLQTLPPSSNEPTFPHPLNPLPKNILDVPPRPLNP
nr:hypothetical protein [Tanacetum cinerariifolium]